MNIDNDPRIDKYLRSLSRKDSARIVQVSELFEEYGFTLSGIYLKKLTGRVWELRTGRWRVLFGIVKQSAVIVHIFFKKRKRPQKKKFI
jgi:phage-related protein